MLKETTENLSLSNDDKPLPKGWRLVRLGDICSPSKEIVEPSSDRAKSLPYLSLEHVESGTGKILSKATEIISDEGKSTTFYFNENHVLYGKLRPYLNKVSLPDFEGRCTTEIIPLLPNENSIREYIALILRQEKLVDSVMKETTGSRMPRADMKVLLDFKIPLPPTIEEQRRIAAILDEQMKAVEEARLAVEAQLKAANLLPNAFLRAVFEREDAQNWNDTIFENVSILQRGYDLPSQDQIKGEFPIITSSGIMGTHHEFREFAPGVVTGRSGSIGKIFYTDQNYFPHNTALFIKDFKGNHPRYIYHLLRKIDLKTVANGTGVPTLDRKEVHKLSIKHPNLETQIKIAEKLDEQMKEVEALKKSLTEKLEAIKKLPAALLRKAFAGEM